MLINTNLYSFRINYFFAILLEMYAQLQLLVAQSIILTINNTTKCVHAIIVHGISTASLDQNKNNESVNDTVAHLGITGNGLVMVTHSH